MDETEEKNTHLNKNSNGHFFLVPLFVFNLQPIRGFLIYLAIAKPGFLFVPIQR